MNFLKLKNVRAIRVFSCFSFGGSGVSLCIFNDFNDKSARRSNIIGIFVRETRHLFLFLKKVPFLSAIFFLSEYTVIVRWDDFG